MKGFKVWDNIMETDTNAFPLGLDMPSNYASGKIYPPGSGKLVWRPAIIGSNPAFDEFIQTRNTDYVINDNNVTINYIVTNNGLLETQNKKKLEAKGVGNAILLSKRNAEDQRNAALGILQAGEIAAIKTDINVIRNHYKNVIEDDIDSATTVQEVKAVTINFPDIS